MARCALVFVMLIGLFFMHGTAMGYLGCHDGTAGATAAADTYSISEANMGHPMHSPAMGAAVLSHSLLQARNLAGIAGFGEPCAATPLRDGMTTFAPPLGALLLVLSIAALGVPYGVRPNACSSRGPPLTGAHLLTKLCISRT
jgi:hypothetical protein